MKLKMLWYNAGLIAAVVAICVVLSVTSPAQTEQLVYAFNGVTGSGPNGGLIFDAQGNLWGTTARGGMGCPGRGCGEIFKLSPTSSGWAFYPIYNFTGATGQYPLSGVVADASGNLYGTTVEGGAHGYGVVYELVTSTGGSYQVLYDFTGGSDGGNPNYGVILDNAGNVYGTTNAGGAKGEGVAFELTPGATGWTETVIQDFNKLEGTGPSPLAWWNGYSYILGTAANGYYNDNGSNGTVYVLSRRPANQVPWQHSVLYAFQGVFVDGAEPAGGVVLDSAGNIYGSTEKPGALEQGFIFKLAAQNFTFTDVFGLPCNGALTYANGYLYGAGGSGGGTGQNAGFAYKFDPGVSGWRYEFGNNNPSGAKHPQAGLAVDASGNAYGAAPVGGDGGGGEIFEIVFP